MTTSGTPGDRPSVSTGRTSTRLGVWEGGLLETASSMNSECVCVCSWHTVQGYVTEWLSSHMLGRQCAYEAECGCTFCVAPCVPSGNDALSVEGTQWCHITSPSLLPPPLSGETSRWLLWAVRAVIWQPCTPDNIPQGSCGYDCSLPPPVWHIKAYLQSGAQKNGWSELKYMKMDTRVIGWHYVKDRHR